MRLMRPIGRRGLMGPMGPIGRGLMGPMGLIGLIGRMGPIGLMGLMGLGLVGCSSEEDLGPLGGRGVPVSLTSYVADYSEANGANRAYGPGAYGSNRTNRANSWAPTGYYELGADDTKPSIGTFFTKDASGGDPVVCDPHRFWYSSGKWHVDEEIEITANNYQLYGYLPYNAATASITPNISYSNGAVLTLNGLSGIMTKDVCVLVGAKEGSSTNPYTYVTATGLTDGSSVVGLYEQSGSDYVLTSDGTYDSGKTYYERKDIQTGKFDCAIKAGDGDDKNYLYLLFDHIYAQLLFKFTINSNYAALRTIKIKRLELMAYTDYTYSSTKKMKKKQSTTITLQANNTGASPIVSVSTLTADNSSGDMDPVLLFYNESSPLVLDPSRWEEYVTYVPEVPSFFILKTTYDVYDKNPSSGHPEGNLIRKNCVAENRINPRALFSKEKLDRGKKYILNLTVNPTYLYVLSEPDLDNPTITLSE